jgi:starvation-inducible DNA-binding protein
MNTTEQLIETFCDNFVNSYRAHSIHFNITGTHFYSYHKLLQKIYEDSENIQDDLGELIRSLGELAPETIGDILNLADLPDTIAYGTDALTLLSLVRDGQEHMVNSYKKLNEVAELEDEVQIANFAQDRIRVHNKFVWMITATLEQ